MNHEKERIHLIRDEIQTWGEKALKKILKEAFLFSLLKKKAPSHLNWHIEIHFVSSAVMKKLNHEYRKKNSVTDILSFSPPSVFYEQGYLGELIICLPVLKAQSSQFNHSIKDELLVLLIHGVLHLFGFDHEKGEKEAQLMALWEKKLMTKLKKGHRFAQGLIARAKSDK